MSFLADRKGNFSTVRLSIFAGAVGLIVIIMGVVLAQFDQNSRRAPFFVALPQGATQWGDVKVIRGDWQQVFYRVPNGDIEAIAQFYAEKMREHYGSEAQTSAESCRRLPPTGSYTNIPNEQRSVGDGLVYDPKYVEGESVPFSWKCLFDNQGFNVMQYTEVIIQPGLFNEDPFLNTLGDVVIVYDQRWQP